MKITIGNKEYTLLLKLKALKKAEREFNVPTESLKAWMTDKCKQGRMAEFLDVTLRCFAFDAAGENPSEAVVDDLDIDASKQATDLIISWFVGEVVKANQELPAETPGKAKAATKKRPDVAADGTGPKS